MKSLMVQMSVTTVLLAISVATADAAVTITADPFTNPITAPAGTPATYSFEVALSDTDNPTELQNFQIRMLLTGPDAGTDVYFTDIGQTIDHPWIYPLLSLATKNVDPTEIFAQTFNFATAGNASDNDGLLRVDFAVAPEAEGLYEFAFVATGPGDTVLSSPTGAIGLTSIGTSVQIAPVPEPAAVLMLLAAVCGGLMVRRRR